MSKIFMRFENNVNVTVKIKCEIVTIMTILCGAVS